MWECVECSKENQDSRDHCGHCTIGRDGSAPRNPQAFEAATSPPLPEPIQETEVCLVADAPVPNAQATDLLGATKPPHTEPNKAVGGEGDGFVGCFGLVCGIILYYALHNGLGRQVPNKA